MSIIAILCLAAMPCGLPWHDDGWQVVERTQAYTIYRCPHGDCPTCRNANTEWGSGHHVILHGFGYRGSFAAGGNVAGEWKRYELYKYRLDRFGRKYDERRIE